MGFVFILRIPSLHYYYFPTDESLYLLVGKSLAEGKLLYKDIWENKPPIGMWFHGAVVWCFGEYANIILRILANFWIVGCCYYFLQILSKYKFSTRSQFISGIFFILALCTPWYSQEFSLELLILLPLLWTNVKVLDIFIDDKRSKSMFFYVGFVCAICFGIKFQVIFIFVGILVSYFVITTFKLAEFVVLITGFFSACVIFLFIMYVQGILLDFWDIGFIYNFDYILIGNNIGENNSWLNVLEYLKSWGVFILLGGLGIITFRLTYFKIPIRLRKSEIFVFIWLISSLLSVLLGGTRFYLHYFWLALPPVLIYACYYYDSYLLPKYPKIAFLSIIVIFIFPLFTYAFFIFATNDSLFKLIRPHINQNGWAESLYNNLRPSVQDELLQIEISKFKTTNNEMLILDFQPETYMKLQKGISNKYHNFNIAFTKMDWLTANSRKHSPISKPETMAMVYKEFDKSTPELVIDFNGIFEEMQDKLPLLLNGYQKKDVGKCTIYYKENQTR